MLQTNKSLFLSHNFTDPLQVCDDEQAAASKARCLLSLVLLIPFNERLDFQTDLTTRIQSFLPGEDLL